MAMFTGSWLLDILILIATLLYLIYLYISSTGDYFKNRAIPFFKPTPFLGILQMFTKSQHDFAHFLYNSFPNEKFYGYFQTKIPTLLVKDPDLVHRIMVKDFAYFHDRGFPVVEHDPLSQNLFNLKGHPWRILRQKLIPTFSTGKLKNMFDQFIKSGDNLMDDIEKVSLSGEAVEARVFIFNFPSEVIGSTAFGLDLSKTSSTIAFIKKINLIFGSNFRQLVLFSLIIICPKIVRLLNITPFTRGANEYFINLTKATKQYRKENNIKRNDYFQLLLTLQEAEENNKNVMPGASADISEEDALINQMEYAPQSYQADSEPKMFTDEGITAQSFVFLTAGTESVTSTLSFALYQIAKNPSIQDRLKEEVRMTLSKHGGWTYQTVKDMTYLDQVVQETQRMYPVVSLLLRECTMSYAIPDSTIVIEKGTIIVIPLGGLQMDPKYHLNPEVFDPDRFIGNNHKPSPTFMPFGDGPRICIAMRFAILEVKVCLARILAQYTVEVNSKTKEPFVFERKSFFPRPVGGIWINFKKDQQESA